MTVGAGGSESERQWRRQEMRTALVELAANIIRVARGAGRPHELLAQARAFVAKADVCLQAGDDGLAQDFEEALALPDRRPSPQAPDHAHEAAEGEEAAMMGALQMAASLLLSQPPQVARGRDELIQGVEALMRSRRR